MPSDFAPPLCFYWKSCRRHAALEKQGRSVCRPCAERLKGVPYPLRPPTREPLYASGRAAAEALDMLEPSPKRRSRAPTAVSGLRQKVQAHHSGR